VSSHQLGWGLTIALASSDLVGDKGWVHSAAKMLDGTPGALCQLGQRMTCLDFLIHVEVGISAFSRDLVSVLSSELTSELARRLLSESPVRTTLYSLRHASMSCLDSAIVVNQ
jgi:hypothetical protein